MIKSSTVRLGRLLLAVGCSTALGLAAGCAAARPPAPSAQPHRALDGTATVRLTTAAAPGNGPARLAGELTSAEAVLGKGDAAPGVMARRALTVQLICLRLAGRPGWARQVTERVAPPQRAAAADDIAGIADLAALTSPSAALPRWKIIPAESLTALRADYRAAQAATGVGWQYLAAINFVETNFGRIDGLSSVGAEGPMQFIPSTWALYGRGDVHRPRDAIFAAARFLAASGAPRDIASAVHAYNPSWRYVDAVLRYAHRLRADPGALGGYYYRQVTYRLTRGWVLLPPGYGSNPAVRPVPLRT